MSFFFFIYAKIFIIIVFAPSCFTRPRPYTHEHRDFEYSALKFVDISYYCFFEPDSVGHSAIFWIMFLLWIRRRLHQSTEHTGNMNNKPHPFCLSNVHTCTNLDWSNARWQYSMPKQIQLYKKGFLYSFREVSVRKKKTYWQFEKWVFASRLVVVNGLFMQ